MGVIDKITPAALSAAHSAASGRKRGRSMRNSHRNTFQSSNLKIQGLKIWNLKIQI